MIKTTKLTSHEKILKYLNSFGNNRFSYKKEDNTIGIYNNNDRFIIPRYLQDKGTKDLCIRFYGEIMYRLGVDNGKRQGHSEGSKSKAAEIRYVLGIHDPDGNDY